MMLSKLQKGQKGFTLIELLIVVAIIGILAAIAIPQFAAYRIRAFNSSALSDARNLSTAEAAFFADWQRYGVTAAAAAAGGGNGAVITNATDMFITSADTSATPVNRTLQIGLGQNVGAVAHVSDGTVAAQYTTFALGAKHLQGDTVFAIDAEASGVYADTTSVKISDPILAASIPQTAVLSVEDDLDGFADFVLR